MELTKLEIKGFKSFGEKAVVHFDADVTGIVGPNGCGKSNIVDAIRWVLGEQSNRMLRSEKSGDIIFNGTRRRRASQLAEVALTFRNTRNILPTEYAEVTVTRRYFRSGESEYLLNGVKCRLKDINNLFMDTGISSDCYAIIESKMVERILDDTNNARRMLFEEAAGISKFRTRKKETHKKLEETAADLDRVEDLLHEISKNLKSLERQAKQTEKYYQIKAEYQQASIQMAKATLSEKLEDLRRIRSQLQEQQDLQSQYAAQASEKEAAIAHLKNQTLEAEKLLSSRQKTLNDFSAKIRKIESEKQLKNERLSHLRDKESNLRQQLENDRNNLQVNEKALAELQEKETQQRREADNTHQLTEQLKEAAQVEKNRLSELRQTAESYRSNLKEKQDQLNRLQKQQEVNRVQVSSLRQQMEKSRDEAGQHSEDLEAFAEKFADIEKRLAQAKENLEATESADQATRTQIEEKRQEKESAQKALQSLNRKLDATQNEYQLTKSLVESLEGFPEAIRFLKKETALGEKLQLLSDIITCPEDYRIAIETFLEPYMNHFVVADEELAMKGIRFLEGDQRGRAHFFLQNRLAQYPSQPALEHPALTPALSIVEYDPNYEQVVRFLLAEVYLLENGRALPEDLPPGLTLLSQDGSLIQKPYAFSGGSVGLFEGKRIGRAQNLKKLGQQIEELKTEKNQLKEKLQAFDGELEALKQQRKSQQIEQLRQQIGQLQQEHVLVKSKHEQAQSLLNGSEDRQEELGEKIAELEQALESKQPKIEELEKALAQAEKESQQTERQLSEQSEIVSEKNQAYNETNLRYHQQQSALQATLQEIGYKQDNLKAIRRRLERNQQELEEALAGIKELEQSQQTGDHDLQGLYQEREQIEQGVTEAEKQYYQYRNQIDGEEQTIKELNRRKEQAATLAGELQNKINELRLAMSNTRERIKVEFEVEISEDDLEDFDDQGYTAQEWQQKVDEAKKRLDKMGPINPMAMEAYREMKERCDFITKERDDLLQARDSLNETIREIDEVARSTFMETFEKVSENFQQVFKSLFTEEDTCGLRLSDPENPLDAKIDIVAQPKGKRPQLISQLSSGEKSLTAISLLFAIYLIKPAPFCIFDEVDAPLDDANVDKFNNIIRDFSKQSQFIIVTHNKITMRNTDTMYGVTMQEQGISTLIPVDMREMAS